MDFDIVHRTTRVNHIPMIWTSNVVKDSNSNSDNIDNAANIMNGHQDYQLDGQIRSGCGILANKLMESEFMKEMIMEQQKSCSINLPSQGAHPGHGMWERL